MPRRKPVALTIAGSDPGGGAGIQADLKTFHQFGAYGEAAITLITVQNTRAFERLECLPADLVADQIRAVIGDIPPDAAKTGALGNRAIIEAIADLARAFDFPLVVDPVLTTKHGGVFLPDDAIAAFKKDLIPHAYLLTPNLEEAALLTDLKVCSLDDMHRAAQVLQAMGARAVLIKGGHLSGGPTDLLLYDGQFIEFSGERIDTRHTHGTGCTLSAAITALLAQGRELPDAVRIAKRYVTEAIRTNPGLGQGAGPLNHHAPAQPRLASADPGE
ncbi:MAG TPA: bifunctional hydroxymethylpyrimidine kinase/phosphomethylpyrimidine kinase [Bryobacteraceae bacterium]|nr:bifunctional hydroxymethylpyrimidine kinase/phosphomethylpyrimidine kinase [Bryobacteraceae bacterium]